MKKIIIAVCLFPLLKCFAQMDPQAVAKAKELLDKTANQMKSYTTIIAEFTNTLENLQTKVTETFSGTVYVKGVKYKLLYQGNEIYCDGQTVWTYLPDEKECNITKAGGNDDAGVNPTKLLENYETDFKYQFIGEKFDNNRALYEIDLYPKNLKKNYSRIRLRIDKTKMQIYSIQYFGKDGNNYTIKISKFTVNTNIDDADLIFNKAAHPGVEMIDLRD